MALISALRACALVLFLCSFCSIASCEVPERSEESPPPARPRDLKALVLETVDAVLADQALRKAYLSVLDVCADQSRNLADQYHLPVLSVITDSLDAYLQDTKASQDESELYLGRPSLADSADGRLFKRAGLLGKIFPGLAGGDGKAGADAGGGGPGGILQGLAGDLLSLTGPALAGAGFFGGLGAGEGAAQGLELASAGDTSTAGAKIAQANGMEKKGLNGVVESAAMGLTASAVRSVKDSRILKIPDLGPVAMSLGVGIGDGTAMGLKLTQKDLGPPENSSGLSGILGSFGFGAANSLTDKVDIGSLTAGIMASSLGAAAMSIGSGIGSGAVSGLKLTQKDMQPPSPSSGADIPGIAGNFAFGLGKSVTGAADINKLLQGGVGGIAKMVGPAASGLGKGLGSGAAVGLGLQSEQPATAAAVMLPDGNIDVGAITQEFASGLASRFLANGTTSKFVTIIMGPGNGSGQAAAGGLGGLTSNLDVGRIANGFARGLLNGAGDGVEAIGGADAILNGTSTTPRGPSPQTNTDFDDSVGGAATGFGQGLGNSAVLTVQKLFSNAESRRLPASSPTAGPPETPKRRVRGPASAPSISSSSLVTRQDGDLGRPQSGGGLSRILNAEAISAILQKGVDIITCEGVGGLVLILVGLRKSGTLTGGGDNTGLIKTVEPFIPKGNIHLINGRNSFDINAKQVTSGLGKSLLEAANGLSINGLRFIPFVVFLVLHIFFAIAALAVLIPLALIHQSTRNTLQRIGIVHMLPAKLNTVFQFVWILGILPSLVLLLIFGVLVASRNAHFQTPHGILGLVTLVVGLTAVGLHLLSSRAAPSEAIKLNKMTVLSHACDQVLMVLGLATMITGFADLENITFCLTAIVSLGQGVLIGTALASLLILGQAVSAIDLLLLWRSRKGRADDAKPTLITQDSKRGHEGQFGS